MTESVDLETNTSITDVGRFFWSALKSISLLTIIQNIWARLQLVKVGLFVASLFLFVLAIILMKEGSRGLAPLIQNQFAITSAANSLGFGWLFAYLIMSGSPVAAAALTFYDAGVVTELGAYAMIIGSRFGASFIVLFIGFVYVLRGQDRSTSLGMGLLSLTVTGSTYFFAFVIGAVILQTGLLDGVQFGSGILLDSIIDLIFEPIVRILVAFLPGWSLFLVGLAIIILSFNLFDRCLPQMTVKESQVGRMSRLVYRPWVIFSLGAAITLISMSVSVSLSILVPLSARGFIRRENVIPYIMGANITTFIDTLLAAVLLGTPLAFTIILTGMTSISIVSVIILATCYHRYERLMLGFVNRVSGNNRILAVFMLVIFAVPIILMLV